MQRRPRWLWVLLAVSAAASVGGLLLRHRVAQTPSLRHASQRGVASASNVVTCDDDSVRLLRSPSDTPAHLMCEQARLVAEQVQDSLVQAPKHVNPRAFAMSVSDWLDPHGLWSAAPDAPFAAALASLAPALLSSFERPEQGAGCSTAGQLGAVLASWIQELRGLYDQSYEEASRAAAQTPDVWEQAAEPAFEDGPVTHPARQLAQQLGRRMGLIAHGLGEQGAPIAEAFRRRLFPPIQAEGWGEVVLAAALRAYVLHVDPHGGWAPLDEETSLYEVELEASGRTRMWSQMHRTVAGLRIEGTAMAPLRPGDLVVSVGPVWTSGLTVEQADQLSILDPADPQPARAIRVLRSGVAGLLSMEVTPKAVHLDASDSPPSVQGDRVSYRDGDVLVLAIPDVPDDLGDEVEAALDRARKQGPPLGVLIDLRGNGGGSIDGAKDALGLFLPGAPLFPMLRRDRSVELETAPSPPLSARWKGPVAVLVDGNTASAAEMIAGALTVYQRGVLVGSRTFGKGCAQEYVDDQAGVGVLRLTTLLYALPDGSPVQRVGLSPPLRLDPTASAEREEGLENAFPTWRGPDVRTRAMMSSVAWPAHSGRVGPCQDPAICQALRLVGAQRSPTARTHKP